jgi:hypothetical protein
MAVEDEVRPESADAIRDLHAAGLRAMNSLGCIAGLLFGGLRSFPTWDR